MNNAEKRSLATIVLTVFITVVLAQLLTYVFAVSGVVNQVEKQEREIVIMQSRIRSTELALARVEIRYENIIEKLERIERKLDN